MLGLIPATENKTMAITDPQDLWYISDVVNQVLAHIPQLTDIKGVQAALKEVSVAHGREIQMNLVFEEDKLLGLNFAFKLDPNNATEPIYFQPNQLEMEVSRCNIILHEQLTSSIDAAPLESQGHLTTYCQQHGEIIIAPASQVDNLHVIETEAQDVLTGTCDKSNKINPGLIRVAHQLASRNEIDGLLLTGVALKAGVTLASLLQSEENPDKHTAGLAIIKRLGMVLPEEFADLKQGEIPKPFSWIDPKSLKQYNFKFEGCFANDSSQAVTPIKLRGFETQHGSNLMHSVFEATLVDSKYNQWSIGQCDFTPSQVRDLSFAIKPTPPNLSPAIATVGESFLEEIEY